MALIDFGGVKEEVITRDEFPMSKALAVLKDETVAVIGYGVQGPAQALNMKDNGFNVIIGQSRAFQAGLGPRRAGRLGARQDAVPHWRSGRAGHHHPDLVSDAGQMSFWPTLKTFLTAGKALYFSHGFSIVYKDQTGVIPPTNIDVILVAPKGSGTSVRRNFLSGAGINSSYAVSQDATGRARERCLRWASPSAPATSSRRLSRGSVQRPDRRARRADGRAGRRHGSAVRRTARARAHPQRSIQRDRRGTDAEPDPAGRRERHGLDVLQLLRHRSARRARLGANSRRPSCRSSRTCTSA